MQTAGIELVCPITVHIPKIRMVADEGCIPYPKIQTTNFILNQMKTEANLKHPLKVLAPPIA